MEEPIKSTKLIPDIDSEKVAQWFKELSALVAKKKPKFLQKYPNDKGGDLFTTGDDTNGYYYLQVGDEIIYFVRYRKVKANGNAFGRQVLVARRRGHPFAVKIAVHVFYHYLLPRFKALISDTQQTQHGKAFWDYALDEAFNKNLNVYCLDRRASPVSLTPLPDMSAVLEHSGIIWGTDEGHLRTPVVISSIPILLKGKYERK